MTLPRRFEETAHRRAFGDRVTKLRKKRGWTQEDMAERSGIHRSYLAGIETGSRNPTLDVIVKVANSLHVPIADLFR